MVYKLFTNHWLSSNHNTENKEHSTDPIDTVVSCYHKDNGYKTISKVLQLQLCNIGLIVCKWNRSWSDAPWKISSHAEIRTVRMVNINPKITYKKLEEVLQALGITVTPVSNTHCQYSLQSCREWKAYMKVHLSLLRCTFKARYQLKYYSLGW